MPATPKLDLPEPSEQPAQIFARIRGTDYTFTELEIGAYDELVKKATREEIDDATGGKFDVTDNGLLMRLMIPKVVSPAPPKELLKTGTRMYRAFASLINELHYGDEPIVLLNADGTPKTPEETDKGNG